MTSSEGQPKPANEVPERGTPIAVLPAVPLPRTHLAISPRDTFLVIVVTFLWALCYPLIKTGLAGAPPLRFATLRATLAGLALLAFSRVTGRSMPKNRRAWLHVLGAGLGATTIGFSGMFLAGERVSPGLATVLANTQPLLAALVGYFVLKESLRGTRAFALLGGFAGIVVIAAPDLFASAGNATFGGIAYVLLGATGVAVGNVFLKLIAGKADPFAAMGWQLLIGALPLFLLSEIFEAGILTQWSGPFLFSLVVLSVFGTALVFVLWLTLLARYELNRVNAYTFLSPVFALLLGAALYSERLSWAQWTGTILVLGSAALATGQYSKVRPNAMGPSHF